MINLVNVNLTAPQQIILDSYIIGNRRFVLLFTHFVITASVVDALAVRFYEKLYPVGVHGQLVQKRKIGHTWLGQRW